MRTSEISSLIASAMIFSGGIQAALGAMLWEIGKADRSDMEFALAPKGYSQFKNDGFYVVGESNPEKDWPYVHPGPHDAWAGRREHTFSILFGLKQTPPVGQCELLLVLQDTQGSGPPKLRIQINGQKFERTLPKGFGDETVNGAFAKGKEHKLSVVFPSSVLKTGDNEVQITTLEGSWMLYDAISFQAPVGAELQGVKSRTLVEAVQAVRALIEKDGQTQQPVLVKLKHFGGDEQVTVKMDGAEPVTMTLSSGEKSEEILTAAVSEPTEKKVRLEVGGQELATRTITLKPARKLTVYILPHSHTDIGYTEIQTAIEKKQVQNLVQGIEYARKTASYPEGARFVWNVEVLWAADLYLKRLDEKAQSHFFEAVKKGQVAL